MAELDRGAKIVLQTFPNDLLRLLFPGVEPGDPVGTEAITAQVLSDRAFAGRGPEGDVVLHVEFEAEPTSDVGHRVTRTACGLYFSHDAPILTTIVYLHPASDGRRPKSGYRLPIGETPLQVRFNTLVLWEDVGADELLKGARPGLMPFVGLARGSDLDHVRLAARTLEHLPILESERADCLAALCLLSGYHFPSEQLLAIITEEALMESKTYLHILEKGHREGREEGREEGRRGLLSELLQARLGVIPRLDAHLATASAEVVDLLARLVVEATSDETLRAAVDRLLEEPGA